MVESVTVQLPQEALQRFRRGAGAAGKPLEEFLADRLMDAVPPLSEDIPAPLCGELNALEQLDEAALRRVAESRLSAGHQRLYSRLLAKNSAGTITAGERQELEDLGNEARQLTLKKAHAYLLLKWRGYAIPSHPELEVAE
ncbi:MAG: hypothetical protein NTY19_08715 [Planctomycetota bacterium]|nr:hypothetical protein [Planctomycetota bacterium]